MQPVRTGTSHHKTYFTWSSTTLRRCRSVAWSTLLFRSIRPLHLPDSNFLPTSRDRPEIHPNPPGTEFPIINIVFPTTVFIMQVPCILPSPNPDHQHSSASLSVYISPSPFMRASLPAKELAADSFVPPIEPEQQSRFGRSLLGDMCQGDGNPRTPTTPARVTFSHSRGSRHLCPAATKGGGYLTFRARNLLAIRTCGMINVIGVLRYVVADIRPGYPRVRLRYLGDIGRSWHLS